jgi:hypothetical protein
LIEKDGGKRKNRRMKDFMTTPAATAPVHRQRTCRACGKKFDYPVKGSAATRHHCEDCVIVAPETRKILERLNNRITQLERQLESQLRRQQEKAAPPPAAG